MTAVLRGIAIAIAIAAVLDPAFTRRVAVPLPVEVLMPPESDPSFERAVQMRSQIQSRLGDRLSINGREEAQALVALGRPTLSDLPAAPVFGLALWERPGVVIESVSAPTAMLGQSAPVAATLHAVGLADRTTTVAMVRNGTAVASIDHRWKSDDERFIAHLEFVPAGAGVHRVRVSATTNTVERPAVADVAIPVRERRLRVLAYEPRPSWPLAFVRRSLESDPLFEVTATVRTTSRSATTTAGAPASLASLQSERFDAVIVGAPDSLTGAEINALDAFVSQRGGALLLLPDRRFAENVRRGFDLPEFDEVILERPLVTAGTGASIRASELLLPRRSDRLSTVSAVRHGNDDRAIVGTLARGAGRIIVSGAMDAWRYRADPSSGFDSYWRGLVADAAADAPPPLGVTVSPSIARPGDQVTISVMLRPTEFDEDAELIEVPLVKAQLLAGAGSGELIRLWPGSAPGRLEGRTSAGRPGTYTASVSIPGASADVPLIVADDVVHPSSASVMSTTFAATSSGGAMVESVDELATRLEALKPRDVEQRSWPMRAPWWILPFTGLLCAEWGLRRRGGKR